MSEPIKISYYKAPQGLFLHFPNGHYRTIPVIRINGKKLTSTFSKDWNFCEGETAIDKVEILVPEAGINRRAELIDPKLQSPKIPLIITPEMVENSWWSWKSDSSYAGISDLYEEKFDVVPEHLEDREFDATLINTIEVTNAHNYNDMKVSVYRNGRYPNSDGHDTISISSVVSFSELERIHTPPFALPVRPCSISSKQTYDIIRKHVKDNINPKHAEITSDYDFCFAVKKKIDIKPFEHKTEITKANGKSYAKPRFKSQHITYKLVEIFEMTHDRDNYGKHTPIAGFEGDSISDLVENVGLYLDELMEFINLPAKECDKCKGTGNLIHTDFDKNKR